MLIDGLVLAEGSEVTNLVVNTGSIFPSIPDQGELFYLNIAQEFFPIGLYFYSGTQWVGISTISALNEAMSIATTVDSNTKR